MLSPSQRRYVAIETAIGVAINTAISIGFVYLAFGGMAVVETEALIPDAVPQSFMIALMSTLVPTMLTRQRMRAGRIDGLATPIPTALRPLPVRALIIAVVAMAIGVALTALLVRGVAPPQLPFVLVLACKAIFGAALAAVVGPVALRLALSDFRGSVR